MKIKRIFLFVISILVFIIFVLDPALGDLISQLHKSDYGWLTKNRECFLPFASGANWHLEVVDSIGIVGRCTSMDLDSLDYPHITYTEGDIGNDGNLKYAYYDGLTWHIERVDSIGDVGWGTSLVLDELDRPHISYLDRTNGDLKYAYWDGIDWQIEHVDTLGRVGLGSSLCLDSLGHPHIAYYDSTAMTLKYTYWNGIWYIEIVDTVERFNWLITYPISLRLDSFDVPRIVYEKNGSVMYGYKNEDTWDVTFIDGGYSPSLALKDGNIPHVAYSDGVLRYAVWSDSIWDKSTIEKKSVWTRYASLQLTPANRSEISYFYADYDNSFFYLKCAVWQDNIWEWETEVVDSVFGLYTSLRFDKYRYPVISYFNYINRDLMVATAIPDVAITGGGLIPHKDDSFKNIFDTLNIYTDSMYQPLAGVRNCGIIPETFDIECSILRDTSVIYSDTWRAINLLAHRNQTAYFDNWIVPSDDSTLYSIIFRTLLPYDSQPDNDSCIIWAFAHKDHGVEELEETSMHILSIISYPNPVVSSVCIKYSITNECKTTLAIYDIAGRLVLKLVNEQKKEGVYSIEWNRKDANGRRVKNGVYFLSLKAGDKTLKNKIILLE